MNITIMTFLLSLLLTIIITCTFTINIIEELEAVSTGNNKIQNISIKTLSIVNDNSPQLSTNIENNNININSNSNSNSNSNHEKSFDHSFQNLFNKTRSLSFAYQDQVGQWEAGIIDNATMIQITKEYNSEFEDVVEQAQSVQKQLNQIIPNNISKLPIYENVLGNFTKSVEFELGSNKHFANYISSGNQSENQMSIDLLSKAFIYENDMLNSYQSLPQ